MSATAEPFFVTDVLRAGSLAYVLPLTSWTLGIAVQRRAQRRRARRARALGGIAVGALGARAALLVAGLGPPAHDGNRLQERGTGGIMIRTMTGYSAKSIDELPTLWNGFAKLARAGLDITAFGANIMDLPPGYSTTSHDEAQSGQQELYVALRGSGSVDIDDARLPLDPDHLVRVDAGTARVLSSGPDGLRVLCIGGVPGGVYEPPEWSSTGE